MNQIVIGTIPMVRSVLVAVALVLLHGCASFQGAPDWNTATTLKTTDPLYQDFIGKYYDSKATVESRQLLRNQFIEIRSGLIDRSYAAFKDSIYTQRVGAGVGVDIATLFLGAAGAALPDVGVKTGASALSAGIIGSKASIDKNVYFDRTLPALLAQMDGMRSQIRGGILAGMATSVQRYPLMQASSDLDAYFHAGTIAGAISAVTTQAGVAKVAADTALRNRLPSEVELTTRLKRLGFQVEKAALTDTVNEIDRCLNKEGELPTKVNDAIKKFLRDQGLNPDGIDVMSDFMVREGKDYEARRAAALADTALGPLLKACAGQ